jgi:hypothetical protein
MTMTNTIHCSISKALIDEWSMKVSRFVFPMVCNRYCDGGFCHAFLHDDMASSLANLHEAVFFEQATKLSAPKNTQVSQRPPLVGL